MAKRGKDLFELLMLRKGGAAPPRRSSAEPIGLQRVGDAVTDFVRRVTGRRTTRGAPYGRLPLASLLVVALLLAVGGLGFVLGRVTAAAQQGPELEARGPRVQRPELMPSGPAAGASDLDAEREVETLSKYFFAPLHYSASQRSRASQLAQHLREHGLGDARIRLMEGRKPGEMRWATLVYVPKQADAATVLVRIQAVPAPSFEPLFEQAAKALTIDRLFTFE